jgi:hypothetical protein
VTTPDESLPPARDSRGKYARTLDSIERDREAAALITRGWTYDRVADHLSYPSRGDAWRGVQRIRREAAALDGNSEQIRQRQLAEIADQRARLWEQIISPPPAISRTGKIVTDDDGNPVPDAQALAAAHALLIRLSQREAAIRGTDAPKRSVSLTGPAGPEEVLAFIETISPEDLRAAIELMRRNTETAAREAADLERGNVIPGELEAPEP